MKQKISRRNFIRTGAVASVALGASDLMAENGTPAVRTQELPSVLGGAKAHQSGWPAWPYWDDADNAEIAKVMNRGVWSRSGLVSEFEEKWAEMNGSKCCLAVVNGTNALSASFMELGIGPGDEVIVSPYTFSASVFGVFYQKAMPVWADIDPLTYQIDPEKIRAKITPRTKAILPVHICGLPSNMPEIMKIAKEHGLYVVEDACQAHFSEIDGKKMGTFGDAGCFSFQTTKVLPIGEGGAILTDNQDYKDLLYSYHNYGYSAGTIPGAFGIHAYRIATKIRMAEYQAAIGLCQLKRFPEQHAKRNENGAYLRTKLAEIPGITPVKYYEGVTSVSHYLFPFIYDEQEFKGLTRDQFVSAMNGEGISTGPGYPNDPLYGQGLIKTQLESDVYKRLYSAEELDFDAYKERNKCPGLLQTFKTSVWLNSNSMFLADKPAMDDIVKAVWKIHDHSEEIKKKMANG